MNEINESIMFTSSESLKELSRSVIPRSSSSNGKPRESSSTCGKMFDLEFYAISFESRTNNFDLCDVDEGRSGKKLVTWGFLEFNVVIVRLFFGGGGFPAPSVSIDFRRPRSPGKICEKTSLKWLFCVVGLFRKYGRGRNE